MLNACCGIAIVDIGVFFRVEGQNIYRGRVGGRSGIAGIGAFQPFIGVGDPIAVRILEIVQFADLERAGGRHIELHAQRIEITERSAVVFMEPDTDHVLAGGETVRIDREFV